MRFLRVYNNSIENALETIRGIRIANAHNQSRKKSEVHVALKSSKKLKSKNQLPKPKPRKIGPPQREREKMRLLKRSVPRQKTNSKILRIFDDASQSHNFIDNKYKLTYNLQLIDSSNNHVTRNHDYI